MPRPEFTDDFTDDELLGYVDEMLSVERMTAIEAALRDSTALRYRIAELRQRRESGEHTVGEIWREHRLSCPSRSGLGSYLLGTLAPPEADYIRFHVEVVGCRYCAANLEDLRQREAASDSSAETRQRRRRFFQSSAGYLRREDADQ